MHMQIMAAVEPPPLVTDCRYKGVGEGVTPIFPEFHAAVGEPLSLCPLSEFNRNTEPVDAAGLPDQKRLPPLVEGEDGTGATPVLSSPDQANVYAAVGLFITVFNL